MTTKSKLQKNTVILDIDFHKPSKERKGDLKNVEVDADQDSLRLTKKFINSEHYAECERIRTKTKQHIRRFAFDSDHLKDGCYLVPLSTLEDIEPTLKQAQADYAKAADQLAVSWNEIIEDAKKRLRSQFNASNYPSAQSIRRKFWMDWRVLSYSTPEASTIGEVLYEQEKKKAQDTWQRIEQEVSLAFRQSFYNLLAHLSEKLQPTADGSKKVLKQAAVDKVTDFLDTFSRRNVMNDTEMTKLVTQAKKVLKGKTAEGLKVAKEEIGGKLATIEKSLGSMIEETKRQFNFED